MEHVKTGSAFVKNSSEIVKHTQHYQLFTKVDIKCHLSETRIQDNFMRFPLTQKPYVTQIWNFIPGLYLGKIENLYFTLARNE